MTVFHDGDFQLLSNGHINCVECDLIWCSHLEECTRQGWDQEALWPEMTELFEIENLEIPMFPSENLWTAVSLTPTKTQFARYKVMWSVETPVFVCNLNPGEGRQVVRSVLYDKMWGTRIRERECKAAHHNVTAQINWQRNLRGPKSGAEQWSVYTTSQCLTCYLRTATDPDFIPSTEGNVWN